MRSWLPCLELGGEHAAPAHVRLLLDCAEICQTSANFMIRGSEVHQETCAACAEICARRAEDCRSMGESMKECAQACERCAESCRRMSGDGRAASH